jgi:hypothetical protein
MELYQLVGSVLGVVDGHGSGVGIAQLSIKMGNRSPRVCQCH